MISVVIPLYNKVSSIAKTLRSIQGQTVEVSEVVIVDDGSTDDSVNEVQQYQMKEPIFGNKIRLIRQTNGGVSKARNRGIAEAKGDIIAFIDADDEWKPTYIETISRLVELYPCCGVYATSYEKIDAYGNKK